jgi:hypothetical protein|tara:strand:+ start:5114 stop:5341 length:228 start_codon:yes stop_codon:yes gene_type:complete
MSLVKIKDNSDWAKDTTTGAIVNINASKIQQDIERQQRLKKEKLQMKDNSEKVEQLQSDMSDMKVLLNKILEKIE